MMGDYAGLPPEAVPLNPAVGLAGGMTYKGPDPFEKPPMPARFRDAKLTRCLVVKEDGSRCKAHPTATGMCVGHTNAARARGDL